LPRSRPARCIESPSRCLRGLSGACPRTSWR
jgi:hypothetical protein